MGGSLGLALKARHFPGRISGYARRVENRDVALKLGVVDEIYDQPEPAIKDADLVIFCVPVLSIPGLVGDCRRSFKPRCILTDVGSTKVELAARIRPLLMGISATYIGSHPIAGSERHGLSASRVDLYEKAVVVITPGHGAPKPVVAQLTQFWEDLGAVVNVMSPEEHDQLIARTSHLPHVMAVLLSLTVGRDGDLRHVGKYCGPGFRDATRIAEGSSEVWHDIIRSNRYCLADELRAYKAELDSFLDVLTKGDFDKIRPLLDQARERRRTLLPTR